jgi:hypothetical protein
MGLYLANVRQAVDLIPLRSDPFGAGFEAMLANGILGAAGLAMILPMFVPSRWRARTPSESEATGAGCTGYHGARLGGIAGPRAGKHPQSDKCSPCRGCYTHLRPRPLRQQDARRTAGNLTSGGEVYWA